MPKQLILTAHAQNRMQKRQIDQAWVEEAVFAAEWVEAEPGSSVIERRFRSINSFGGRILRVVCVETNSSIRVISVMFDRKARRKP